jgi:DinB family protein
MEIIDQLERTKAETLRYFDLPDADLRKTYGPGKWSIRYLLHHLADSETVFFDRVRRVLSEPKQVIWVHDQDAWAKALNYSIVPLDLAKGNYVSSRNGNMYYAGLHYDRSHELPFVHSVTGLRTLKDEFDKIVSHNQHHVAHIKKALQSSPS